MIKHTLRFITSHNATHVIVARVDYDQSPINTQPLNHMVQLTEDRVRGLLESRNSLHTDRVDNIQHTIDIQHRHTDM
jgi:arsenate reductase-like glutaredoxin family protein